MSPGHSGSTLLTLLLATHPDVATIGERRYLRIRVLRKDSPGNRCICGSLIPECEFLEDLFEIGRRMLPWYLRGVDYPSFVYGNNERVNRRLRRLSNRVDYGRKPGLVSQVLSSPARALIRANKAVIDRVLETENASVFVDGSKSTIDLNHMSATSDFDLTLIHLTRDGRGQFHSMLRVRPHRSESEIAEIFCHWHERISRLVDRFDGTVIRVKYEDLCERPLEELRRIAVEAGLNPNGMSLDFRSGASHAIGNERLMKSTSIDIVNDESWRSELSEEQLTTFERIAGDANRSFGYLD
jgi:hypothetical protein